MHMLIIVSTVRTTEIYRVTILCVWLDRLLVTEESTPSVIQTGSVVDVPLPFVACSFEIANLVHALRHVALGLVDTLTQWSHTAQHLCLLPPRFVRSEHSTSTGRARA